jgi:hypothetical protein
MGGDGDMERTEVKLTTSPCQSGWGRDDKKDDEGLTHALRLCRAPLGEGNLLE